MIKKKIVSHFSGGGEDVLEDKNKTMSDITVIF